MALCGVVVAVFSEEPPARRWLAIVLLGGFSVGLAAVGVSMLLESWRHRLIVSDERVESIGVTGRTTLNLREITGAERRPLGGS